MTGKPEIEIRPEIEISFLIIREILERQNMGKPTWFSRLVEIFEEEIQKEEISGDRTVRTIVGHWLDAFEHLFVIDSHYGEYEKGKAANLYRIVDEELLRTLEEKYWGKLEDKTNTSEEIKLSDLFLEILTDVRKEE